VEFLRAFNLNFEFPDQFLKTFQASVLQSKLLKTETVFLSDLVWLFLARRSIFIAMISVMFSGEYVESVIFNKNVSISGHRGPSSSCILIAKDSTAITFCAQKGNQCSGFSFPAIPDDWFQVHFQI
jgi:hypothetical protein